MRPAAVKKKSPEYLWTHGTVDAAEAAVLYKLNPSPQTLERLERLERLGYRFVVGNHPYLDRTPKWRDAFGDIRRVALTNHRHSGLSVATIWAVR